MSTPIQAIEPAQQHDKLKATLQERLALAGGYVLHELSDGSYLISRWGMTRPLPDLYAVSRFATQVGAR